MSSSSYAVQPPGGEKKPWSAKKLIKVLETKYGFSYNEKDDYIDAIDEEIVEGALVFNYEGDFIVECDEPEEEGVRKSISSSASAGGLSTRIQLTPMPGYCILQRI